MPKPKSSSLELTDNVRIKFEDCRKYFNLAAVLVGRLGGVMPGMQRRRPRILHKPLHKTADSRGIVSSLLSLLLLLCNQFVAASAQSAPQPNLPAAPVARIPVATNVTSHATAINLNLAATSTAQVPLASSGAAAAGQPGCVPIRVGGQVFSVQPGAQFLTPAENVAAYQVRLTGQQSLVLGALGNAIGGSFSISQRLSQYVNNLQIPEGVTGRLNSSVLDLTGSVINSGVLVIAPSNSAQASISATNILNNQGALISSGFSAFGLPNLPVNLSLKATDSIINNGVISSSGTLSLVAGHSIVNQSPAGASGVAAVMQAVNSVSLTSASGTIKNSGLIASNLGNVSLYAPVGRDLVIDNVNGQLRALQGAVNVGSGACGVMANSRIFGGDIVANQVNLNAGSGSVDANLNSISGLVNASGSAAHVTVNDGTLEMGNVNLSGDPTFYNSNGSININGNISVGEALTIAASGNITSTANGAFTLSAPSSDINLIAGATFTAAGGAGSTSVGPFAGSSGTGTPANSITITTAAQSATGGNIDFSNGGVSVISTAATTAGAAGGNVRLVAFPGSAGVGGQILLTSDSTINSSGSGIGSNGNVTVIAGARTSTFTYTAGPSGLTGTLLAPSVDPIGTGSLSAPDAIALGNIVANGGLPSAGGAINIANMTPAFTNGTTSMSFNSTGSISSGNDFSVVPTNFGNGRIALNGNISGRTVAVNGGTSGDISIARQVSGSSSVRLVANGTGNIVQTNSSPSINSPTITVTSLQGNVGSSVINPLIIQNGTSGAISLANSSPSSGSLFIQSVSSGLLTLNFINAAGTAYINNNGGNAATYSTAAGILESGSIRAGTINLSTVSSNGLNNGNITIASVLNAANAVVLSAGGAGNVAIPLGYSGDFILSPAVALSSVTGNIGSAATPIYMGNYYSGSPASPLTLSANITGTGNTGSAYLQYDGANSSLILKGSSVGGTLQVTTQANLYGPASNYGITVAQPVSAANVLFNTISGNHNNNGNIVLASTVNGTNSVNFTTGGTGSITQTVSGATIFSPTVVLSAKTGGSIGVYNVRGVQFSNVAGNANPVNLTANATGDVFMIGNGAVNLVGGSSSGGPNGFSLLASGGNLTLGAGSGISALSGMLSLSSTASVSQLSSGTTLVSPNVQLYGGANVGSAAIPIGITNGINPISLSAFGNSSVYVNTTSSATVSGASNGAFQVFTGGNLILTSMGNQPTSVLLQTANNGNIAINGNVWTTSSGSITLNANGAGLITEGNGAGLMSGTLRMTSGSGAIGSSASPILVYGGSVVANTAGSVYVNFSNPNFASIGTGLAGGSSSAGGLFNISVSGTNGAVLNVRSPINAPTVALTNYGSGGINLGALVTATTSATLATRGLGSIGQTISTATINSPTISLSTLGGNVGTSKNNPLVVENGLVGAVSISNASPGTANMYVQNVSAGAVNTNYINVAGTAYINNSGNAYGAAAGINIIGSINADSIDLSTVSANGLNNGSITISSVLVAKTAIALAAGGSGNVAISTGYSGTFLLSPSVSLSSVTGNIGSSVQPISMANYYSGSPASPLTLSANITGAGNIGSAYIDYQGGNNTLILNGSSVGGTLQVTTLAALFGPTSNYAITVVAPVRANNLILSTVSGNQNNNGNIVLNSTVTGLTSVNLTTGGSGSITQTFSGASVISPTIVLAAKNGGTIGAYNVQSVQLSNVAGNANAVTLTANASGDVFMVSNSSVNLLGASSSGGVNGFSLLAAGGNLNINSGASVTAPVGHIDLSAAVSIAQSLTGAITLMSPAVQLYAGSSIGSSVSPICVNNASGVLSLNAGANNSVFVNSLGATVASGATNGLFQLMAGGNLTLTGMNNQPSSVILQTSNNGSIAVNANVWTTSTGAITLRANGAGNISEGNGAGLMTGTLTMSSGSGSIGSAVTPILVYAGSLVANTSGSVYVNYANPTSATIGTGLLSGSSSAGGTFQVNVSGTYAGPLNVTSPLTASTVALTHNGNGNINLSAMITGTTSATLAAKGFGNITQSIGSATINSPTIRLTSNGGNVGSSISNPLVIENGLVGSVSLSNASPGTANMFVQNVSAGSVNLNYINVSGTAYVNNSGNAYGSAAGITILGSIAAGTIYLSTVSPNGINNGNITITSVLNARNSVILSAGGAGNVAIPTGYSGDFILSPSVALSSVRGNIGSAQTPIYIANFYSGSPASPMMLSANITGAGNIGSAYVEYDGANNSLFLNGSSVGGTLQVTTLANLYGPSSNLGITVIAPVRANNVVLSTNSGNRNNNGSITLQSTVTGTTSVNLAAGGAGNITQTLGSPLVFSPTISLSSVLGSIGSPFANVITYSSGVLNINNASSQVGSVNVQNVGTSVTLNAPHSGGDMNIWSTGSMLVVGAGTTQNGSINLTSSTGNLQIGNGIQPTSLMATNGSISLRNLDTNLADAASIVVMSATLKGSSTTPGVGQVSIFFGAAPTIANPISFKPYAVIAQSGGAHVYAGVNGFTTTAPTSLLNAEGRDIIISTANRYAGAIRISGASITADPPSLSSVKLSQTGINSASGMLAMTDKANSFAANTEKSMPAVATNATTTTMLVPSLRTSDSSAIANSTVAGRAASYSSIDSFNAFAASNCSSASQVDESNVAVYSGKAFRASDAKQSKAVNHIAPVSFGSRMQPMPAGLIEFQVQPASSHKDRVVKLNLQNGSVLFAADSDVEIATLFGQVHIARGAVVLMVAKSNVVSIYDLHDRHSNDVTVTTGTCMTSLCPGHHLSIASSNVRSFEDANCFESIGHRNVQSNVLSNGVMQFSSEFSVMSALTGLKPLAAMQYSRDAHDQSIVRDLLKNAAIIQTVKASNGAYQRTAGRLAVAKN
jgi:hypothetical protein